MNTKSEQQTKHNNRTDQQYNGAATLLTETALFIKSPIVHNCQMYVKDVADEVCNQFEK